ncbi:MAG: HdeD family acid-resistance protein [Thermoleophilia bacterium]
MNTVSGGQKSMGIMSVQVTRDTWKWYLTLGIILVVTGGFAMVFPLGAAYGIEVFVGILLLISGSAYLINSMADRRHGFVWQLLLALIYIGVGIMLLVYPLSGVVTLTLVLGICFLVSGTFKSLIALTSRKSQGWGMLLVSGLLGIILGILILASWPSSSAWVIGLLVGIDLLFAGMTMIMLALAARNPGSMATA